MTNAKSPLWGRDFIIDCVICFLINLAYYLTMVVITDYALNHLHASLSQAGFACGVIILGVLAARLFIGQSIERIGTKKCLIAGMIIFLGSSVVNLWISDLTFLYLIRFVQGIGFGASSTATATIMAQLVPRDRRGEGTAYFSMFVTLATAIGPFAGLFLYGDGDLSQNLQLASVLLVIGTVLSCILVAPAVTFSEQPIAQPKKRFSVGTLLEPTALPLSLVTFLVSVGFASLLSYISPFTSEQGLKVGGQFFFLAYAVATVCTRPFTGRLFDMKGDNIVMLPSFIFFAAGLCLLGMAGTNIAVLVAGLLIGMGFGTYMSCSQAIVISLCPSDKMGMANSTFFIFMDLGVGLGPLLLGTVVQHLHFSGMYEFMAVVVLVCLVLYYLMHGRRASLRRHHQTAESHS